VIPNSCGAKDVLKINAALAAGSTLNLQDGDDVLLKGGSGSVATDTKSVITSVDGGDGIDTLAASFITAGNGDQFKNFEVLGLTNSTVDASLLTGSTITDLALLAGGGTYSGVNPTQSLTVTNIGSNSGTTTLSYGVAGLGATDTFTVNFADPNADLTTATAWAAATAANVLAGTITAQGVENYVLISGGTRAWNSITLGANSDAETVTISGASNLDLAIASSGFGSTSSPATGVTSIDGSAATGKLAINITGVVESAYGITVKGGSAADTITTGGEDVTLTLGAGKDTVIAVANAVTVANANNATAAEAVSEMITITDLEHGDVIDFSSGSITSNGVSLVDVSAATTLLQAINIAVNDGGTSNVDLDFFYYGGNTYAVYDAAAATSNGMQSNDVLIKIVGLFDLSNSVLGTDGALTITA
jgi:S-layer protein